MEIVLLEDVHASYGSNWCRIANTSGVEQIQIGDRFRERGHGAGAEEVEVAGIDISPVGGHSRLFFYRCANATQPMKHNLGAALEQVGIKTEPVYELPPEETGDYAVAEPEQVTAEIVSATITYADDLPTVQTQPLVPLKRRRGRPIGSKNKTTQEVALPVGFE